MTKQDNLFDLFDSRRDAGDTRDQMIIAAVTSGTSLNTATKRYATWAKDRGISSAAVSHKADALESLAELWGEDAPTVDDVREAIPTLVEDYGIAESTARDYVKAYCDDNGHAYPVLNPREAIFAWFKTEAPHHGAEDCKAEFMTFATEELGRSQSNANEYWKGYELHLYLTK